MGPGEQQQSKQQAQRGSAAADEREIVHKGFAHNGAGALVQGGEIGLGHRLHHISPMDAEQPQQVGQQHKQHALAQLVGHILKQSHHSAREQFIDASYPQKMFHRQPRQGKDQQTQAKRHDQGNRHPELHVHARAVGAETGRQVTAECAEQRRSRDGTQNGPEHADRPQTGELEHAVALHAEQDEKASEGRHDRHQAERPVGPGNGRCVGVADAAQQAEGHDADGGVVDKPKGAVNRPARRPHDPLLEPGNGKVPQHQGHRSHDQHRRQQQQAAFDRGEHRIPFQAVCKTQQFPVQHRFPPLSISPIPVFR